MKLSRWFALALAPLLATAGTVIATASPASAWTPKAPPMTTPWTNSVSTTNPLPEYPRPQLTRTDWQNLNGIWDFAVTGSGQTSPPATFGEQIRVPYPVESALSGIQRKVTENDKLWYRRTFTVPANWSGRRVQLNFGAVDWQSTVWVNGTQAGAQHSGGYDAFTYDITSLLNGGTNTIVVGVYDPTDAGSQAVGKQRRNDVLPHAGGGIFYTAASGIWQTVWLEPTPAARITRVDLVPNLSNNTLRSTVSGAGIAGQTVTVTVLTGATVVGSASGAVGAALAVPVPNAHRWSPNDPFLYTVRVELKSGTTIV